MATTPTFPTDERDRTLPGVESPLAEATIAAPTPTDLSNEVEELPDGSAVVRLPDRLGRADPGFYDNLVEDLSPGKRSKLALELLEHVERDKESRAKRDKQYSEGLKKSGLSGEEGKAAFDGGSVVVHPMIAEACVDFASRAIKELFPPDGPVKIKMFSYPDELKQSKADRQQRWLNWQLTSTQGRLVVKEYYAELERLLSQLPLGGSQYQKFWFAGRIHTEFVPVSRVLLPYAASDFYTAARVTHWLTLTRQEFDKRIKSKMYVDPEAVEYAVVPETSAAEESLEKIEGKESPAYNEDGLRDVYEIQVDYELEEDTYAKGEVVPYVITVDDSSKKILAIYRNWDEADTAFEKLQWFVDWTFIPWEGAVGIGLFHLIGSLSTSATGALRALLDSAFANNVPSALKLKGNVPGQTVRPGVGEVAEIDAPPNVDDIRKIAMPFPFNPPSAVLFQLLEWLTANAKGVITTSEEKVADATNSMPVGTTLALIEQGSNPFSAIHARLHRSQARALEILCRLNYHYLDEEQARSDVADLKITRSDFAPPYDIAPVSDPNIFSDSQRYAQNQALLQLSADQRVRYNVHAIHRRMLRTMKIDDADDLLPPLPMPKRLDPVAENIGAFSGAPLAAFPDQNHIAHLITHLDFAMSPAIGGIVGPQVIGPIIEHCKQHIVFYYLRKMAEVGQDVYNRTGMAQDDMLVAVTSQTAAPAIVEELQPILDRLGALLQQLSAASASNPAQDPRAMALLQAAQAETERKAAADAANQALRQQQQQLDLQLKQQQQQLDLQLQQQRLELDRMRVQAETQFEQVKLQLDRYRIESSAQTELTKNEFDAQLRSETELQKNREDNETHAATELQKNREDNETQLTIAQMQLAAKTATELLSPASPTPTSPPTKPKGRRR